MYYAIVFLPLVGTIIAALIALAGARARFPGGSGSPGAENHAHGPVDESHARAAPSPDGDRAALQPSHAEPAPAEPAAGSRPAELVTTVFLFASMVLSWLAFVD